MKIKDYYLNFLNEHEENFSYVDGDSVREIIDTDISKSEDYIKIDFVTTYGKPMSVLTKYSDFKQWWSNNKESSNIFKDYLSTFLKNSQDSKDFQMNEIIDDEGNIMSNDDLPNNATNSMVGTNLKWDLEKVYKHAIPTSLRYRTGGMTGYVTW